MSDSHYLEADGEHTAGGRRMAAYERYRCRSHIIGAFSSVFDCALPIDHDGAHESASGTSWVLTPDDDHCVTTEYLLTNGRTWQSEGTHWHPVALLARRARTKQAAGERMRHDLQHYERTHRRTASQVALRWVWRAKRAVRTTSDRQTDA